MSPALKSIAMALAAALLLANAEPKYEGTICVASAHFWQGDSGDIRHIRSVAVPASFRRRFEAGGCERFQLVEESLVDWHLKFGDERTTAAALAYLETGYTKGAPAPEVFGDYLAAAWEDGQRTIAALPPAGDPRRPSRERLRKSRSLRRAAEAVTAFDRYVQLARFYARSAELYNSASFLEKAELFFAPARAGLKTLFADGAEPYANLGDIVYAPAYRLNDVLDLELRLAVLRARFSRAPSDIDTAAAIAARRYRPIFTTAADNAREHSGEFCEFDAEPQDEELQALKHACREENSIEKSTTNFWRSRAHLDLLMAADPVHFESVERDRHSTGSVFRRRPLPLSMPSTPTGFPRLRPPRGCSATKSWATVKN